MPDARSWELAGVQVGDVLHDLVKGINVIAFHSQRRLVGVELNLTEEREGTNNVMTRISYNTNNTVL